MLNYIIRRILLLFPVLLGISIVTFLFMYFSPGDPAEITLRVLLDVDQPPQEAVDELREEMGLNDPIHIQYIKWLNRTLHGGLGYSYLTKRSALDEILTALPATVILAVTSMFISILIAIPFGILSAVKQHSLFDRATLLLSLLVVSVPEFFLAVILILIFALHFKILPVAGYGGIEHLILPSLALAMCMAAITTRLMRTSMLEVIWQDYITMARAKGLKESVIVLKHALRNAVIPVITYMGTQFGYLFGGTVIIETIFMWPGIGRLLVESVYAKDIFVVQGCVLVITLIYVFINLFIDVSYTFIDPRIRYKGRNGT